MATEEHPSVTLFREYLRIPTVHPSPNYRAVEPFFKRIATEIGLEYRSIELVNEKPIVILTWRGSDESLPSLLLNSHIDVVPVERDRWSVDPFSAHKDEKGNIFARGAQDMKCVGIQHIEAVRRLKASGYTPLRTIHISFVPDEEIGGHDGMEKFVETEEFRKLKIGLALDEGLANPGENCIVYYGERSAWWLRLEVKGPTGHGSQLFERTAADSLLKFVNRLMAWRDEEVKRFHHGPEGSKKLNLGDVTSINVNAIKLGRFTADYSSWQNNIIPSEAVAGVDMRIEPSVNLDELRKKLWAWAEELDISISFIQTPVPSNNPSIIDATKSPWWDTFTRVVGVPIETQIFPAATDSRYIRAKGIQAYGFSPMNHTPVLLHDHDEFLNETTFLKGIDVMTNLVKALSNLPRHSLDA